jgi:micrococcal nuclease
VRSIIFFENGKNIYLLQTMSSESSSEEKFKPDWNSLMKIPFIYSARVVDIYDGDTITCDINLGFNLDFKFQKIRLYGINAPERRGIEKNEGLKSRDALREWILGKDILLYTIESHSKHEEVDERKGMYGRWLGIIVHEGENINDKLVQQGYAKYREY